MAQSKSRLSVIVALCLAVFLAGGRMAYAGEKLALVIGMSDYSHVTPLINADSDARGVGDTLRKIGFKVTEAIDQPLAQLVGTINDFSFRSETADIALIYYAGHGVEAQGENFLLPTDVNIAQISDIGSQAIPVNSLLDAVRSARRLKVVILDSCRNNPFATSSSDDTSAAKIVLAAADDIRRGGLGAPSPQRGTLVVYAAKAGEVAYDGEGGHSPFARALMEHMPDAQVEIGMMFRRVRDAVMAETKNLQEPHFYGSLSGIPFFLSSDNAAIADNSDPRKAWGSLAPEQAVQLASLAQEGNVRALIGLGYMSLSEQEKRFDPKKAAEYFSRAAALGDSEAMFELGKLYEKGIGVNQDFAKALELYRNSADLGFADAINDLGFLYYQGAAGVRQDPEEAVKLFLKAADLKHPQAMYNVAALIDDGVIGGKTPQDAAHYLYTALRAGVRDVLNQLANRPNQFKVDTRKALQEILRSNGFYSGSIDGSYGKGTQRALRSAFGEDVGNG